MCETASRAQRLDAMNFGEKCGVDGCTNKVVVQAKKVLQLCQRHTVDREAMLLQASRGSPLIVDGTKKTLRQYLEELEVTDQKGFLEHLGDFATKPLG